MRQAAGTSGYNADCTLMAERISDVTRYGRWQGQLSSRGSLGHLERLGGISGGGLACGSHNQEAILHLHSDVLAAEACEHRGEDMCIRYSCRGKEDQDFAYIQTSALR